MSYEDDQIFTLSLSDDESEIYYSTKVDGMTASDVLDAFVRGMVALTFGEQTVKNAMKEYLEWSE
jgi:hypothetical protein